MKFCSECAAPVGRTWVARDSRERYFCTACGTTHYQNPRVIVSCVVHCGDEILMVKRAMEPARGQWFIPSGFLEIGETLEEGAARETHEETGVIVDPEKLELCSIINMPTVEQVAVAFRVELAVKPAIYAGPECLEVAFMSEDQIQPQQLAWRESMGNGPRKFFNELRSHAFSIHLISIASKNGHAFKTRENKIVPDSELPES